MERTQLEKISSVKRRTKGEQEDCFSKDFHKRGSEIKRGLPFTFQRSREEKMIFTEERPLNLESH